MLMYTRLETGSDYIAQAIVCIISYANLKYKKSTCKLSVKTKTFQLRRTILPFPP